MLSRHEKKDKSYFFHIADVENERACTFLFQSYKASNAEKTMLTLYISRDNSLVMTPLFFHACHSAKNVLFYNYMAKRRLRTRRNPSAKAKKATRTNGLFQDFVQIPYYNVS